MTLLLLLLLLLGERGSAVIMALCHKPEGRGFETLAVDQPHMQREW
jgi:hypothetical protein